MKNKNINERDDEIEVEEDDDSQKSKGKKYGTGVERKQNYIIEKAAEESGIHPDTVKTSWEACWAVMQDELEVGNWVKLHGKGLFYLSKRRSRIGRNPSTLEEFEVPEREAMAFQTSPAYAKRLREIRARRKMKEFGGDSTQN